MLLAFKIFIKSLLWPSLYFGGILTSILSIFKKAEWGLLLLVFIIPQPNIYYKIHSYPMGYILIDFLLLSVLLGIFFQKISSEKSGNEKWIILLIVVSYLSIWNCSLNFSLPLPLFTGSELFVEWKNYVRAFLLYFFVLKIIKSEDQQKIVLLITCLVILLLAIRSYRNFSGGASFNWDKRVGGPFNACGLGSNHFGAFMASYVCVMLGLFLVDGNNKIRKYLYLATALFTLHPILFSYSRGAYLGFGGAIFLMGLLKNKKLLFTLIICIALWQVVLPESVVDRISMTEDTESGQLENSAAGRLELWSRAYQIFIGNPIFGIGYTGFSIEMKRAENGVVSAGVTLTDTHNFFVKTLCEQGLLGFMILMIVFIQSIKSGWKLFKTGRTPFNRGLGLGFMAAVFCLVITNMFGDRFSYLVSGCYFWAIWGLVDRGLLNIKYEENQMPGEQVKNKYLMKVLA